MSRWVRGLLFSAWLVAGCSGEGPPDVDGGADSSAPDVCADFDCPMDNSVCVEVGGDPSCVCRPGFSGPECMADAECTETTCSGHGTCALVDGAPECTCDTGHLGDACAECDAAAGYLPDGEGGCSLDPCSPNPCADDPDRQLCELTPTGVACRCNAGTHDEGGVCVPDTTCTPTSCSGHGTCSMSSMEIACDCDMGWMGRFCEGCDADGGYHPDGAGGCTTDLCLPNPCMGENETVCVAEGGTTRCECDAGHHREGGVCVVDEVCVAGTCSDHGMCSVVDGLTLCMCDMGWAGAICDGCDSMGGYHPDGAGGCTTDPCTPNPCTDPGRGVCADDGGGSAICSCDPGLHEDGVGGCTADPCVPDPCAASGRACRDDGTGTAECYTPVCDDMNPCTMDRFTGGRCTYTPLTDGAGCSTTLCTSGQTCMTGTCGGGTLVVCDDANPCTVDSCDAATGCEAINDDTLIPDDGLFCTVDSCLSGVESHGPDDTLCDDGLFCTGTEVCTPSSGDADARGCVQMAAPTPPGRSSPCRFYGACDEMSRSFPLTELGAGAGCDDGIACTTGDRCVTTGGACAGTPMATCPSLTCTTTTAWPGTVDIKTASVAGAITLDASPVPASITTSSSWDVNLYAVSHDTGARHNIAYLEYVYSSSGTHTLRAGSDRIDTRLVPGIYDILYRRGETGTAGVVSETAPSDPFAHGLRTLRSDVVVGPGANTLDIDIPTGSVSGTITLDGGAAPASITTSSSWDVNLYAVSRDTGARHNIAYLEYVYSSSGTHTLRAGSDRIDTRLVPGTYDILYRRGETGTAGVVSETAPTDPFAHGLRTLMSGVVISAGSNTLDIDIPTASITGAITLDASPVPASITTSSSWDVNLYAVSRDTGARHNIAYLEYVYSSSGTHTLRAGSDVIDTRLVPGTYDILYRRGETGTAGVVSETAPTDPFAHGLRTLMSGVMISAGANTLDIDIPSGDVGGTITLDGGAAPTSITTSSSWDVNLYAVSRDTGARHNIAYLEYVYSSSGTHTLRAGSDVIDTRLVPGTYDILYRRGETGTAGLVSETAPTDPFAHGLRTLMSGVVISAGSNTLNVDIGTSSIMGTVTLDAGPLPASITTSSSWDIDLYAVSQDTGARHRIAYVEYVYSSSGTHALAAGSGSIDTRLVPGTYDILYRRGETGTAGLVSETAVGDPFAHGLRTLMTDVVISAGAASLNVDIPSASLASSITLDGGPLPPSITTSSSWDVDLYAVSRDTGARHRIHYLEYIYSSSGTHTLASGADAVATRLVPGTYDLLYRRGETGTAGVVSETAPTDPYAHGLRNLGACFRVE